MQAGELTRHKNDRRTIRAVICLYLLLALVSWLAMPVVARAVLLPSACRAAASPDRLGAVLVIMSPEESQSGYGLLRDALATAGYASYLYVVPEENFSERSASDAVPDPGSAIGQAIIDFTGLCGFSADEIWVIAGSQMSSFVFTGMNPAGAGGLLLLAPHDWPAPAVALQSSWTDHGQLIILAAQKPDSAANRFYESLTGDDATLFPGTELQQARGGMSYLSIDGRISLTLFSGLIDAFAFISPRVLAELTAQLNDRQPKTDLASTTLPVAVSRQAATQLYRLAVSLALLLSVPFVISLLLGQDDRQAVATATGSGPAVELLFWLAALIVAATLSWLLLRVTDGRISWVAWLVLLAPGCHGWIHYLWRVFVLRPEQGSDESGSTSSRILFAAVPAVLLLPALLVLTLMPVPGYWLPDQIIWLVVLVLVSLAIGPIGTGSDLMTMHHSGKSGWPFLTRIIPWLLLPPVALIIFGLQAGLVAVLITLAACWSSRFGLAAARISRSRWLASLVQAVCHVGLIFPLALLL